MFLVSLMPLRVLCSHAAAYAYMLSLPKISPVASYACMTSLTKSRMDMLARTDLRDALNELFSADLGDALEEPFL